MYKILINHKAYYSRLLKYNFYNNRRLYHILELRNRYKSNRDCNLFNFHKDYSHMAYGGLKFKCYNFK